MKIELSASGIVLAKGQFLNLSEAEGGRIVNEGGIVWITQDGDPRDIVLSKGESFVFDRGSRTIVQAFEPAVVTIADPTARPRRHAFAAWVRRLRQLTRRMAMAPAWAG